MKITDLLDNATSGNQQNMKATDLLRQDHERVRELFNQYRSLMDEDTGNVEKRDLFLQIEKEITVHSQAEEEIFYPAVRKAPADDAERLVLESAEEHAIIKQLIDQLRRAKAGDETFDAKMKVLMDIVEHHAEEEENEVFRDAEELGDKVLDRLGRQIADRKQVLMTRPARRRASSRGRSSTTSRRTPSRSATRSTRATRSTSRTSRGTPARRSASSSRSTAKPAARRASAGSRGRKKRSTKRS